MENPIGISRRIGLNPVLDVHTYSTSTPVSQLCQPAAVPWDEYNQFNLQNINVPTLHKWKNNENILEDFKKFKWSCMYIFDGFMAHISNDKVKTNMFLIWAGPDAKNIYKNLHLPSSQQYNLDAELKFRSVKQHDIETTLSTITYYV